MRARTRTCQCVCLSVYSSSARRGMSARSPGQAGTMAGVCRFSKVNPSHGSRIARLACNTLHSLRGLLKQAVPGRGTGRSLAGKPSSCSLLGSPPATGPSPSLGCWGCGGMWPGWGAVEENPPDQSAFPSSPPTLSTDCLLLSFFNQRTPF